MPYGQAVCVSGLRVFGLANGAKPAVPVFQAKRESDVRLTVTAQAEGATGYNILWGTAPDKLYHSWMVFGTCELTMDALAKGQAYYLRVDAFNASGITEGTISTVSATAE